MSIYKSRSFSLEDTQYVKFMELCKAKGYNASARVRTILDAEIERLEKLED